MISDPSNLIRAIRDAAVKRGIIVVATCAASEAVELQWDWPTEPTCSWAGWSIGEGNQDGSMARVEGSMNNDSSARALIDIARDANRLVCIVGCGARKLDRRAPARALYTSNLFRMSLRFAESISSEVYILSAKHGIVTLDQELEPYEFTFDGWRKREIEDWGCRCVARIPTMDRPRPQLVLFCGETYAHAMRAGASWEGWPRPVEPLRKTTLGARLQWLRKALGEEQIRCACHPAKGRCRGFEDYCSCLCHERLNGGHPGSAA